MKKLRRLLNHRRMKAGTWYADDPPMSQRLLEEFGGVIPYDLPFWPSAPDVGLPKTWTPQGGYAITELTLAEARADSGSETVPWPSGRWFRGRRVATVWVKRDAATGKLSRSLGCWFHEAANERSANPQRHLSRMLGLSRLVYWRPVRRRPLVRVDRRVTAWPDCRVYA